MADVHPGFSLVGVAVADQKMPTLTTDIVRQMLERTRR
jgi:hypothetical protein